MFPTDVQVAVPSYRRHQTVRRDTLAWLHQMGVPWVQVAVFVVEEEAGDYRASLSAELALGLRVVEGPLGLHHMRNRIQRFYHAGTRLLQVDDDLRGLSLLQEDTSVDDPRSSRRWPLSPCSPGAFAEIVSSAFEGLERRGWGLWGIYPVRNGFFMKDLPEVTYDLRFCVGVLWGTVVRAESLDLSMEEKEDFERTLLHYRADGGVIRYNHVAPVTRYYKTPGGIQARGYDRAAAAEASCQLLIERFPGLCRIYRGKKNGMPEVRLRDRSGPSG